MEQFNHTIDGDLEPLDESVLVTDLDMGEKVSSGGVIILNDDGVDRGIKPRWAKVYKVGKLVDEVKPDEWVLINHGRWTRGIKINDDSVVRMIDRNDILMVSDKKLG